MASPSQWADQRVVRHPPLQVLAQDAVDILELE
jgi:hypothetical protein